MTDSVLLENEKKHIKGKEFILYLVAVFFYTMMTDAKTLSSYLNRIIGSENMFEVVRDSELKSDKLSA